jgi:hypothetical protein
MSFIHPLLLGGLLLVGIPVLIHLIMRQKPKHLLFPAFRFLVRQHRSNQRRLRLRHLLLLALRVLLIAAVCLALAQPRLFSERFNDAKDRPIAAVLLIDTSLSMEYKVLERTRLDDAKKRAEELLDDLPRGSRVAVLDSADLGGEWLPSLEKARERVGALNPRPANAPVTRQLGQAYRLFNDLEQEPGNDGEPLPRFLYVFSDRTTACWDVGEAKALPRPEDIHAVFVDVGVDDPADLRLALQPLSRQVVNPGGPIEVSVDVRATGADAKNEIVFLIDEKPMGEQPIKLSAGQSAPMTVQRQAGLGQGDDPPGRLKLGLHQVEAKLAVPDDLAFNNRVYATFKVQEGRRILVLADQERDAELWVRVLRKSHAFPYDLRTALPADLDLKQYRAVCLLNVTNPDNELWDKLKDYVSAGNGLAVVPGGDGWTPRHDAYNDDRGARELLGAKLVGPVDKGEEPGALWKELASDVPRATLHPIVARFREPDFTFTPADLPRARHYWKFEPAPDKARLVATYADQGNWPALLERRLGKGHVLLFTSAMDGRTDSGHRAPNNFLEPPGWFYPILVRLAVGYLAGDAEPANFNFICGQTVTVNLPPTPFVPFYTLLGPGLGSGVDVPREKGQNQLLITQAVQPGNYTIVDNNGTRVAAFSLNVRPEESLLDRVPIAEIESLMGPGSVVAVEGNVSLRDVLEGRWQQPRELFTGLMILVLLVLAVENLLSNRFYRRTAEDESPTASVPRPVVAEPQPAVRSAP